MNIRIIWICTTDMTIRMNLADGVICIWRVDKNCQDFL